MKNKITKSQSIQEKIDNRSIIIVVFVTWAFLVLINYFSKHPVDLKYLIFIFSTFSGKVTSKTLLLFLDYFLSMLLLSVFIINSYFLGKKIFKWLRINIPSFIEEFVFAVGLGVGIFIYLTFFLGIFGLLYREVFYTETILIFILAIRNLINLYLEKKKLQYKKDNFSKDYFIFSHGVKFAGFLLVILIFINFIMSFVPELFYDSLVYHLGAPNFYIIKHKIVEMPYRVGSYYPFNMEMLYTYALLLKEEGLPKLMHFSSGILLLLSIYAFCKNYLSPKIGILACAFFYSIPICFMNSWITGNDIGLSYFFFLAFYSLINYFVKQEKRWFFISAIFSGIAMGTKYTGIFTLFGISMLILWCEFYKRKNKFLTVSKSVFLYFVILMFFMSPWLIKNIIQTGNPIYPFLYKWLGGKNLIVYKGSTILPSQLQSMKLKEILFSPWKLTMTGNDSMTFIGPLFLLFAPIIFFIKNKKEIIKYSLIFFCFSYLAWGIGTFKFRYFLPALAIFSIVNAYGIFYLREQLPKIFGKLVYLLFIIVLATNIYWAFVIMHSNYSPFNLVIGKQSKDEYLSYTKPGYPNPSYKVYKYINEKLPLNSKIMILGESKIHYIKRDFIANNVHNFTPVILWTHSLKDSEKLYKKIKKENITHILINLREAIRVAGYKLWHWTERDLEIFDRFWKKYVKEIYYAEGVYLYEVLSEKEADKPHKAPFNFLLALHKKNYKPNSLLNIYMENKMWNKAIDEFNSYLRLGADVYQQLGYLYYKIGNLEKAFQMYMEAYKRHPDNQQIKQNIEFLKIKLKKVSY